MSTPIIKLLASQITLGTTANTVSLARAVRVYNDNITTALITRKNADGNNLGTVSIATKDALILEKDYNDTLESNSASGVVAVSIAFRG
mgnify:CR=1 FL=1